MGCLILLRHGESMWNRLNLFCGWVDVPLSKRGIREAQQAGEALVGVTIDVVFTSVLQRAIETALIALAEHPSGRVPVMVHEGSGPQSRWSLPPAELQGQLIPVFQSAALNERMYGELQGLNKDLARERFGVEQVQIWRRSFDEAPPGGESLQMTAQRTLPYFREAILPRLERGETVLVAAHGNSLRSIIMDIERMSPEQILQFELATGEPRIYQYRGGLFNRVEIS
jgi:2,3-bisphosphoglycerate-dependent phosphoglycerate mutase